MVELDVKAYFESARKRNSKELHNKGQTVFDYQAINLSVQCLNMEEQIFYKAGAIV